MTKKEIVKQISDKAKLPQLQTKEVVQMTFDAIIAALATDGRIELRNFGVFVVRTRKPRKARNPRTSDLVDIEARNVVTFHPGKVMTERVKDAPPSFAPPRKARRPAAEPVGAGVNGDAARLGDDDPAGRPRKPR